jgi:transposase-like protein
MGRRIGPAKIRRYSLEFKLKAVQLSSQPGVLIKDVAESLCIHPFMLSKWRKQVRDGELVGGAATRLQPNSPSKHRTPTWSRASSTCTTASLSERCDTARIPSCPRTCS